MSASKAKGSRNERRSRDLLRAAGYSVTKAGGSLGMFDLIGIGTTDVVLVQCKTNRTASPAEREMIQLFKAPPNTRKLLHVWFDRIKLPDVIEL